MYTSKAAWNSFHYCGAGARDDHEMLAVRCLTGKKITSLHTGEKQYDSLENGDILVLRSAEQCLVRVTSNSIDKKPTYIITYRSARDPVTET